MPELSQDPFAEAMARAIFLKDASSMHHGDLYNPLGQQYSSFFASDNGLHPMMQKPGHYHGQETNKFLGMSAQSPFADPDVFLRPPSFLPVDSELSKLHQPVVGGYSPYALQNYQPMQLEVPEIDECSSWMKNVLDDFPAITTQELSPAAAVGNVSFDLLPPPDCSPPSIGLGPIPLTALPEPAPVDDSAATPPPPATPAVTATIQSGVGPSPLIRVPTPAEVTPVSPTPKTLKPRVSKRGQKSSEKQKKVSNLEQLEHVRRERQRRDDMSFKISTLECLLPPAGANLKRDRASIVHDSVHYVKSLQQQVEELKKTFSDLKVSKSARSGVLVRSDQVKTKNPEMTAAACGSKAKQQVKMKNLELAAAAAAAACGSKANKQVEYHIQVEGESAARLEICKCRPDYMSRAMKVLEQLDLDVCRCTITKMCDFTLCVIFAKPRLTSSQFVTASSVVTAIRSSIELS